MRRGKRRPSGAEITAEQIGGADRDSRGNHFWIRTTPTSAGGWSTAAGAVDHVIIVEVPHRKSRGVIGRTAAGVTGRAVIPRGKYRQDPRRAQRLKVRFKIERAATR